jgi:mono/diheme cytochrome c family protein
MRRVVVGLALVWALAVIISAQAPATQAPPARRAAAPAAPPSIFQKYCFECHGLTKPEADLSIEKLVQRNAVGPDAADWERVVEMLEQGVMPPLEASKFPTDEERANAIGWIRTSLKVYETEHAGEPGRVTVRRLTSAEYAYAVRDLTGFEIPVGIDASSDSVGGEGFTNFGDVQFVQDSNIERYLEAAKTVADHAVIGAGPLEFYSDAGKTGRELFALNRINELHQREASASSRAKADGHSGSISTARPSTSRGSTSIASRSAIRPRRCAGSRRKKASPAASQITSGRCVNTPNTRYPARDTIDRWAKLPAPTADVAASIAAARAGCDEIYKALTTWPSWFFARGDSRGGRRGRREPAPVRRHVAQSRSQPPLHVSARPAGGARARCADDAGRTDEGLPDVHEHQSDSRRDAGGDLAQSARRHATSTGGTWRSGAGRHARRARLDSRSVNTASARVSAGGRRKDVRVRDESRRHGDRPRRFRDDRHGVVHGGDSARARHDRGAPGRGRGWQGFETPSSG